jgi:hypothetical protein
MLLDDPYPGLRWVVFVSHLGGVLVFLGWVVKTPRELHSTGPKKAALSQHRSHEFSYSLVLYP